MTDVNEATLITRLREMTLKQLKLLAKNLSIKLTGSTNKAEVIDRMLGMAQIEQFMGTVTLIMAIQLTRTSMMKQREF